MERKETYSISSELDSFGVNRFTLSIFILLGIAMLFDGYDTSIVNYTLPIMKEQWGLDGMAAGSLSSWSLFGLIIGGALGGIISDGIGRKKTLVGAVALYSLFTFPQGFADSFVVFALFRVLAGIGLGSCIPVVTTYFSESTPTNRRALFITLGMAWMVLGYVAGGLVGGQVSNIGWIPFDQETGSGGFYESSIIAGFDNWRICYLIGALPLLYSIILFFTLKETPHWYASKNRLDEAAKRLSQISVKALGKARVYDPAALRVAPKPKSKGPLALFSKKYLLATLGIWSTYFIACFVIYGMNAWVPAWLASPSMGFGTSVGSLLAVVMNGASVIACLCVGFISEIIGRRRSLLTGFALSIVAIATAVQLIVPGISFAFAMAVMVFLGFATNYTITGIQPLMAESYPTEFRNTGVSWCQAFGRLGGALAPIVLGAVLTYTNNNYAEAFIFLIAPLALGFICTLVFIRREYRGKSIDQLQSETEAI